MSALRETRSVCGFCGVGCGVVLTTENGRVVGVHGDPTHPANRGALCTKGLALHETIEGPDRLLHPQARAAKGAPLARISWDAAEARLAGALAAARQGRGQDAIGLYLSGQLLTEDYYALNKLARGYLGTNHVDSNSRLCMSSAVSAYQRAFGVDGPPCSYEDLEHADLFLVVGANMAWCHPVLFSRIESARTERGNAARVARRPAPRLVVLDPRRSATAECADLHVPLRPGSDAVFATALLAELARRGRLDDAYIDAHTENFEALEAVLPDFGAARVERACGVPFALLEQVADWWCDAKAALSLFAMGVNQSAHGTDTANTLINLHLATGQLGRPGAGPFSLTGQPNAMGGREVGAMATLLAAHRSPACADDRRELERLWGCGPLPATSGRTAVELFQHAADGGLDVLWIVATNPAVTLPDQALVRRALERTPLVVLQDVVGGTDTARYADLLLPAAGWGEKSGTMTNSERRVSRVRAAVPPPGEARADWQIAARIAARMGFGSAFAWPSDREIFAEHIATTAGRDCDLGGMTAERLDEGPLQWPCPSAEHPGTARLYADGVFGTPSGRARFVVPRGLAVAQPTSDAVPFALTTGRVRDHWHTLTKTGRVARLCGHSPVPELELSPGDAARLGIADGDRVRVSAPAGAFEMAARASDTLRDGTAFAPMHWSDTTGGGALVNAALPALLDPHSRQPELKHVPVRIERVSAQAATADLAPETRTLCVCREVSFGAVRSAIGGGAASVADVARRSGAGTGCGSCVPEVRGMLRRARKSAARPRLVVVGNGMVGHRFVETLLEHGGAERFEVIVLGEEPRPAYDRVHLSDLFAGRSAGELALASAEDYAAHGVALRIGVRAASIEREARVLVTQDGERIAYDQLVLATGSSPFVPPVPGTEKRGVFVYRTIEDVEAIQAAARGAKKGIVIGGGLLGLEAAKALRDFGLETHVVEATPRLMPRQLDAAGSAALVRRIQALGVQVHLGKAIARVEGAESTTGLRFSDGSTLGADLVAISAGIRPRDELAVACGLACGPRGGVAVDDSLCSDDPRIFAIGEAASHRGVVYGLVAPGYEMADALAWNLATSGAEPRRFDGADLSTRLKLLGVEVASLGDPFAGGDAARAVVLQDLRRDVYAKLVLSDDASRLVGGILVGDASQYGRLLQLVRDGAALPEDAEALLFGARTPAGTAEAGGDDAAQVCSCNNVTRGALYAAIRDGGCDSVAALKKATKAGTGCGGCLPLVSQILGTELAAAGHATANALCEHFAYSRQELFQIVQVTGARSFESLCASHGQGDGCEICKPAVASILASLWNEPIQHQPTIQDTNDRFLANIQRGGTYSVVPRVPGGEITPEKLIVLGEVARRYGLYCKITGGQRIDLLGARVEQLPDIWRDLVEAGFESGHAYGKAMRTIKSCVGTTWCRYGVQDSTALAIRLEERYRGIRAPHKLKSAVSGCIRECAEAQSKDFGVIATEKGWNLYVCGNGGSKPRHADLLASDVDEETLVRLIDRFLMYYIRTADRLTRTARWLEALPGGIEYLRRVVVDDHLGIAAELERQIQHLVDTYACEWKQVVESAELQARFRHFANSREPDETLRFVEERGQRRPADWERAASCPPLARATLAADASWVPLASTGEVPHDGGIAVRYGDVQLAVYHVAAQDAWYATQNRCPHTGDMVLGRGIVGDQGGRPKIACPQHKKTFDLETGAGLSDPEYCVATFPVKVEEGKVYVKLPPPSRLARMLAGIVGALLFAFAPGAARAQEAPAPPPDGFHATPSLFWKSGDHRIDLGASFRARGEAWRAFVDDTEWYTGLRTRVRAQYGFQQKYFAVAEFQNVELLGMNEDGTGAMATYRSANKSGDNASGNDLRALYVEGRFPWNSFARIGRQDIKLGHEVLYSEPNWRYLKTARLGERLVGTVGWSQVERAFDGLAGAVEYAGVQLYGFAAQPTTGVFDAESAYSNQNNITVGGAVLTVKRGTLLETGEFGLFGLGHADERPVHEGGLADGLQVGTLGAHWLGVQPLGPGQLDTLVWAAVQFGEYNSQDHRAGAGIVEVGYQLPDVFAKPWLRGGINAASGDHNPDDNDHRTFFNMLPTNHLYYGFADQLSFQNLVNPFVQMRLAPHPMLALNFFVHWFWKSDEDDLRYAGTGAFDKSSFGFPGTATPGQTRIGTEYDVVATFTPHRVATFEVGYSHLDGGAMYRTSADRDLDFFYASAELRY
ncbi:MAG TPA: nitrite reductase large subunit NirB [Myxococcota bacterium]|nr:nitrite reductase large subunit NirB [Myxococcota bacterium]